MPPTVPVAAPTAPPTIAPIGPAALPPAAAPCSAPRTVPCACAASGSAMVARRTIGTNTLIFIKLSGLVIVQTHFGITLVNQRLRGSFRQTKAAAPEYRRGGLATLSLHGLLHLL